MYGNTKLAIMSTLPTLWVCEKLDWELNACEPKGNQKIAVENKKARLYSSGT